MIDSQRSLASSLNTNDSIFFHHLGCSEETHLCVSLSLLANAEKRNLAKAQNAQRKEEIQKRLEKVQTQLGTKTKQASTTSMTKRGSFTVNRNAVQPFCLLSIRFVEFQLVQQCYERPDSRARASLVIVGHGCPHLIETPERKFGLGKRFEFVGQWKRY